MLVRCLYFVCLCCLVLCVVCIRVCGFAIILKFHHNFFLSSGSAQLGEENKTRETTGEISRPIS